MKDSKYYKKYFKEKKDNKTWLSKILICIIILLTCLIITNFSNNLKEKFKNNFLENNISFAKFNKIYKNIMSKDESNDQPDEILVSNNIGINSSSKTEYNGSYKFNVSNEYPVPVLASGIIVYIGDKDNLNNTIIIQGNDGIDIWYSNIEIDNYSLYDYVKKDAILGTSKTNEIIITIMKDGKKIPYDEYFN